jgi:hypothetical protein
MRKLLNYHASQGQKLDDLEVLIDQLIEKYSALIAFIITINVGNKLLTRIKIYGNAPRDPDAFFKNRCSVRLFYESKTIDQAALEQIALLAQKAPLVSNRQIGQLFIFTETEKCKQILIYKEGNKGFDETAGAILVITYAMILVYITHFLGLGSCMLSWSMDAKRDKPQRMVMSLSGNEVEVTLIAIMHLKDQFCVTSSPRRDLQGTAKFNLTINI